MSARKILIVDDELSVRQSLREWFLEDGWAVTTAEDGNAALEALKLDLYAFPALLAPPPLPVDYDIPPLKAKVKSLKF